MFHGSYRPPDGILLDEDDADQNTHGRRPSEEPGFIGKVARATMRPISIVPASAFVLVRHVTMLTMDVCTWVEQLNN